MPRRCVFLTVVMFVILLSPSIAYAGDPITLDGQFADWTGRANITDRTGDAFLTGDITEFAWTTNDNESNLYFMIKRNRYNNVWDLAPAFYKVNLDINDNGIYHSGNDRYLLVSYFPHLDGLVIVSLFRGNGQLVKTYSGNWGEATSQNWERSLPDNWSQALPGNWHNAFPDDWEGTLPNDWSKWFHKDWDEWYYNDWNEWFPSAWHDLFPANWGGALPRGGTQCEFYATMNDLGMYPAQPIRMYAESVVLPPDRVPNNGDIQWSPIPIMPTWALAALFVAGLAAAIIIIKRRMA